MNATNPAQIMKTLLIFCTLTGFTAFSPLWAQSPLQPIRDAENNFSTEMSCVGERAAVLHFAAPAGQVFEQGTVAAATAWPKRRGAAVPPPAWHPAWADVSQSGDLAYTSGPWQRAATSRLPAAQGEYVTVWQHPRSGPWKFLAHMRVEHAPVVQPVAAGAAQPALRPAPATPTPAPAAVLLALDRKFGEAALHNPAKAYLHTLSDEASLYRAGQPPLTGATAHLATEYSGPGYQFAPATAELAAAGDLGVVIGTVRRAAAPGQLEASGNYLHLWRREAVGGWHLAVEMVDLTPEVKAVAAK